LLPAQIAAPLRQLMKDRRPDAVAAILQKTADGVGLRWGPGATDGHRPARNPLSVLTCHADLDRHAMVDGHRSTRLRL